MKSIDSEMPGFQEPPGDLELKGVNEARVSDTETSALPSLRPSSIAHEASNSPTSPVSGYLLSPGRPPSAAVSSTKPHEFSEEPFYDKHKTAGSRIFGKLASQDHKIMRSSIILFPLSFVNPRDEQRFYNRIVQTFEIRARTAAIASVIMFLVFWICTAVCLYEGIFPCSEPWTRGIYNVCMTLILLSSVVPYVASTASAFRKYIEVLLYVSVLLTATVIGMWIVFNSLFEFSRHFHRTKIWLNVYIYIIPFWSCILMDIVMQASTSNVIQTAIFINREELARNNVPESTFFIVTTLADCLFGLTISVLLFMGRWFLELQERVEFLRRMGCGECGVPVLGVSTLVRALILLSAQAQNIFVCLITGFIRQTRATDQIRKLKDASAKKRRKKGATIVEDIMIMLEKVIHNIEEVSIETSLPCLAEGQELLRQCQEILTDTDNLYSVRYQAKGEGAEEEALQEQFLQIYAEKQFFRLPTRVRFGDVTGIQYDSEAATHEISIKPGQLDKPGAVRSFGLVHLHDPMKKHMAVFELAPPLMMAHEEAFAIGRDWEVDILQLSRLRPNILLEVGAVLLCDKMEAILASPTSLLNYLYKLQSCYGDNPYHNRIHGAAVAHATSCLMRMLYVYEAVDHSDLNDIAVIIAALGHDAGHPGRSNQFFINTADNLAVLFNDASVLENTHSAITFKCLETDGANIFRDVTPEIFRGIRKRVIELILTTDMGQHFEAVSRFRLRRQAAGFNYLQDVDDMWLVIRMCIKCADLGHALVDWRQHLDWSLRVAEEFYQQGENELRLGLKVSPLCDRNAHADFAKSQKGFLEFVVQPLVTQLEELEHGASVRTECLQRLAFNKFKWEEWAAEQYSPPIPEEYTKMKTDAFLASQMLVSLYVKGQRLTKIRHSNSATEATTLRSVSASGPRMLLETNKPPETLKAQPEVPHEKQKSLVLISRESSSGSSFTRPTLRRRHSSETRQTLES